MMDQEQAPEALTTSTSFTTRKLNAEAPEFVPRSSATAPPQQSVLQNVYARPPPFVSPLPPAYYGYENFYQQPPMQFYGYNSNQLSPVELAADRNNGSPATATKNGLSDAHLKILNQARFGTRATEVEFYFSDINLATTDQLFRFMSKDPEGYVSDNLSVLYWIKKVMACEIWEHDAMWIFSFHCAFVKGHLVSEDGKMVKRRHTLTEADMEELQSRIVIAENLPEDHSHQNLMRIFSSVGSVKSIRTCPPQNSNNSASSASKTGKGDAMHFNGKLHAFVEFESVELAEKAVIELTDEGNWRNGLKVRLLFKSVKPTQGRGRKIDNEGHPIGRKDEATIPEMQCSEESHLGDSQLQSDFQFHEHQGRPFQREDSGSSNVQRKGRNNIAGNAKAKAKAKAKSKGKGQGQGQGRGRPQHLVNGGIYPPPVEVSVSSEKPTAAKTSPVPRMPDGTKGFSMGRGKPVDLKIA
ncbi:UNVERIFIED_CONTAM: La-related protein 6B [Sesamum radiatum]|uniref:La-related protein 6B n=1 Tax=Sesamum radiatum TaxID=300843 RepID=A0AAW2TGG2_SESRA